MKYPELKGFPIIGLSLVLIIAILGFLRPYFGDNELLPFAALIIHIIIVLIVLVAMPGRFKGIFIGAFIARVLFMFWDLYARDIFKLPNSGADSEMYWWQAVDVSNDITLLAEQIRGGPYAKMLGMLFYFIGPYRIIGHYINVLGGLMVVVTVYKSLKLLRMQQSTVKNVLLLAAFFPNSMVMSAILLREILPTMFVALSLYYFIKWYKLGNNFDTLISFSMLAIAAVFHSGVLGIYVGYAFVYLFYKRRTHRFSFSFRTIVAFIVVGGFAYIASTQFGDAIFGKFDQLEETEDIFEISNVRFGGSAYLTGMEINNPAQLVVYGPIKMFYFLTAPLPWDWRNGMDVFSFVFDSMLYLLTLWYILKNWRYFRRQKPLIKGLIITLIGVAFIFGIGVGNTGTAIRHRQKIVPLILVLLGVLLDEKKQHKLIFLQKAQRVYQRIKQQNDGKL